STFHHSPLVRLARRSHQRAGNKVHFPGAVCAGRSCQSWEKRGRAAGLSGRHGARAVLFGQSGIAIAHARHLFRFPDPVLFSQGGFADRSECLDCRCRPHRAFSRTKFCGILPLTRYFKFDPREGMYTTLMMSTGLTFGSISALFGLTNHIIDQAQYTVLLTAVIGSAVVPTLIAQIWFRPRFEPLEEDA